MGLMGTKVLVAQTYLSFEGATPPSGWTNTGTNPLTTDSAHYKVGRKSLKWVWNAKDTLVADNPDSLLTFSKSSANTIGLYTWVYNENPIKDSLKFLITDSAKTVNLSFKMYMNFKGWRCAYVDLKGDLNYKFRAGKPLRYLNIIAPSTGSGNFYFDLFEIENSALWHKGNDYFVNKDPAPYYDFIGPRKLKPDTSLVNLSDTVFVNNIQKKLESWIVDASAVQGDKRGYLKSRLSGIQNWITATTKGKYSTIYHLKFARKSDNSVIAYDSVTHLGVGLFPESFTYSQQISDYVSGVLLQLALNYKINKVKSDLQRCIDIFDWMYDQGMADSSVMGSLYLQNVQFTAFPHAFFILRNDLPISTFNNTLNTIHWMSMIGTALGNKYVSMDSKNADDIRGEGVGKLIYALSLKNQKERIVWLDSLKSFFNFAFSPAPGYTDIFKYDYSTYHHEGPYTCAYGNNALHQATLIYSFLDSTKFSLSNSTYNQLRNTWIRYDLFSTNYGTPAGTGGRFPLKTLAMQDATQAIAALALTQKGLSDDSLRGIYIRLMNIDTASLRANLITQSASSIFYTQSLGAAKDLVKALNLPLTSFRDSIEPSGLTYMPYSGLFINRHKGWLTTIKGFSRYIYDYEFIHTTDNYLGRYLSYGNMEISSSVNKKFRLVDSCYDWAHIAGTTAKYLPMSVIKVQDSAISSSWRFSDQTFLGGVRLNDSVGTFSMNLHDTTRAFDSSFRAMKSSFFFGDVIYCMGSSIRNIDNANSTHTTLYQTLLPPKSSPVVYINGVVDTILHNYATSSNNLSIKDSWGNAYIVFGGNDSLYINRELRNNLVNNSNNTTLLYRTYDAAYLSHGKAPNNKKYNYAVLIQPSQKTIDTMMNATNPVFQVLRQDDSAHVIYHTTKGVFGFAFFTPTSHINFNRSILNRVYSPSILMESINSDSVSRTIAFTDPDLRRTTGKGDTVNGAYKLDSVDVKGKYLLSSGDLSNVSIKYLGSNLSRLYINANEGRTYKVQLVAIDAAAKAAPFTKGNIAVVRLSNVSSGGNQVFIDEYDDLGTVKQSIPLDSLYQPLADSATEEGYLTLSGDGQFLGLTGYANSTVASSGLYGSRFDTLNRAVAFIKYDGSIHRKNIIPSFDTTKLFYPKSVYSSNGNDFWVGYGHSSTSYGGVMYGKMSNSLPLLTSITPWNTGTSIRQLNINASDSSLYLTQGESPIYKFPSGTLPTDSIVAPANQPSTVSMPSKAGAKSFFFVKNGNDKLLYVAYSSSSGGGIIKYLENVSGGWDSVGYYDTASSNYLSITGKLTTNGVTLFAVRSAVNSNTNSALVKINDNLVVPFNQATAIVLDSASNVTNKIFRGVSIVPQLNTILLNIKKPTPTIIDSARLTTFSIYPNPAKDKITIAFGDAYVNRSEVMLNIYDASGKRFLNKKMVSTRELYIPIGNIPKGVYFIRLNIGHEMPVIKAFIKE